MTTKVTCCELRLKLLLSGGYKMVDVVETVHDRRLLVGCVQICLARRTRQVAAALVSMLKRFVFACHFCFVSDIAIFVLKRDVKLQLTN